MTASKNAAASTDFDRLDAELSRWLRIRTTLRAQRDREPSPLDEVSLALRKVRATLSTMTNDDACSEDSRALAARAYRWSIRVARELEAIEQLSLDPIAEWTRFEAFAPFAVAFFDSVLAAPFAGRPRDLTIARLRREVDVVLSPLVLAMTSSAMAA